MSTNPNLKTPSVLKSRIKIRVLGTKVTLLEPLRVAAEQDLNIDIEYILKDGIEAQTIAALHPDSFDVYDQWFHDIDMIWPTASLQAVDTRKIKDWDKLVSLPHLNEDFYGQDALIPKLGSAPAQRLYVQYNGELGSKPTHHVSLVPTVHNADSFALINSNADQTSNSWADLISDNSGVGIGLQSDASIGALDAILAFKAQGLLDCKDIGNLSIEEIDELIELTRAIQVRHRKKKKIHFWRQGGALTQKAISGERIQSSMWWSLYLELKAKGSDISLITPKEGYRGWYGGLGLSRHLSECTLEAGYAYINWWHSGYAGALMARNGAYMGDIEKLKLHLNEDEFSFWYDGKRAQQPIENAYGQVVFQAGEKREGGSYMERMSRIMVWNTVMDEHNYLVRRWDSLDV